MGGKDAAMLERRLTTIEGWQRTLAFAILVGAFLMAGPLILLTGAIAALTLKIGRQNGRVGKLEEEWNAHKRTIEELKPYERLKLIEDALFAVQNYARVGRYVAVILAAGVVIMGGPNLAQFLKGP